jgi:hypothetical protein
MSPSAFKLIVPPKQIIPALRKFEPFTLIGVKANLLFANDRSIPRNKLRAACPIKSAADKKITKKSKTILTFTHVAKNQLVAI